MAVAPAVILPALLFKNDNFAVPHLFKDCCRYGSAIDQRRANSLTIIITNHQNLIEIDGHTFFGVNFLDPNYAQACDLLETTPLALPAIFSLVGTETNEGCVIERLEHRAVVHEAPAAAANHWAGMTFRPGRPRGIESLRRHRLMNGFTHSDVGRFDWLTFPILNEDTRLAMSANPRTGELRVQGFETDGAATTVFDLKERTET